jgi:hypothetical protein
MEELGNAVVAALNSGVNDEEELGRVEELVAVLLGALVVLVLDVVIQGNVNSIGILKLIEGLFFVPKIKRNKEGFVILICF